MRQAALPARSFQWAAASSYNLVGNEQAEPGFEADALFTGERRAVGFGGLVGIGPGKADGHHLALPDRPLAIGRRMLLVGDLALPLAVRTGVGAVGVEERVAAAQCTVAHHHDALIAALNPVEHLDGDVIEPVPDHGIGSAPPVVPSIE